MPKYEEPAEGEWVQPVEEGYMMACCDCGKVHRVDFRVIDGRAQFRVFDAPRSTGQVRRHRKGIQRYRGVCDFLRDAIATGMLDKRCHETARRTIEHAERMRVY